MAQRPAESGELTSMGLTGTPFILFVCVLALAALAGVIWVAPRAARRVPARVGLLLVSQVLLLAALLTVANAYFAFYGSWGDLLGMSGAGGGGTGDPVGPHARAASASTGPDPLLVPTHDAFVDGHQLPAKDGRLEAVTIHGARSGITALAYVYLPPQYFQDRTRRFPVTLALTGYPGNAQNLVTRLRLPQTAAQEIAARRLKPMIFVMMRPMLTPPRDTECTDVPNGPLAETFFARDLPAAVETAYRTVPAPTGWSAMGDSTGGYCALKLAMRHSDRFAAAISLSGYYKALRDITTGDLYGGSPAYRNENDLDWRLRHRPAPPVDVLVTTSKVGEKDYQATMRFIALARSPMRVASITLPTGGHHFSVWNRELTPALRWLNGRLGV
ncbi:alpha/beta hydrolase-fold protein [Actinoallomurus sp. NPDC052308]|uniref:alpha/beta hydrolase n=1 Tax=Actinoallomurus sp. NPDC052308 TaxID=3155530 RepID=UPI003424006A